MLASHWIGIFTPVKSGRWAAAETMPSFFRRNHRVVQPLQEASANFDLEDLQPLFEQVAQLIPSGFGRAEIGSLVGMANAMAVDEEKEVTFRITYEGQTTAFKVGIFMDVNGG